MDWISADVNMKLIDYSENIDDYEFFHLDPNFLFGALQVILNIQQCHTYAQLPVIIECDDGC